MKVIITGVTGMVGEGVLLECLQNPKVTAVLMVSRKPYPLDHPKLKALILPDFFELDKHASTVAAYDACFFCAGISSVGMKEDKYTFITYDTTLAFAKALIAANNQMSFCFVSGSHTDSTEKGKLMWARVKGKTENDLARLPFKAEYNFRPGAMLPVPGQKNWKSVYKLIVKIIRAISPKRVLTLNEVGKAMVNAVSDNYAGNILEIADIKALAR